LDVGGRHERSEDVEVVIHLLAPVALDGDVRHALALRMILAILGGGAPALPVLGQYA
jgi:hypothetical protein